MKGIYEIRNIVNGKVYIGQSICIESRIKRHKRELAKGIHHNHHLQRSYNKYGKDKFTYNILYEATDSEDLDKLEMQFIKDHNAFTFGYNSTLGGKGDLGMIVTDEFRKRMSQIVSGTNNPNYGHRWTDEMKKRLSEKMSQGQRKGSNNARAIKVIRVEDLHIYGTQLEAAIDSGVSCAASVIRCINHKNYVANGYHFVKYSDELYRYLLDDDNHFSYLCSCYLQSKTIKIADLTNKKFYNKSEFIREINHQTGITTRRLRQLIDSQKNFTINNIKYQLLVA